MSDEMRQAHRTWADGRFTEGKLIVSGVLLPASGDRFGFTICRASSVEEAEELMASDPVIVAGLVSVRVVEFEAHVRASDLASAFGDIPSIDSRDPHRDDTRRERIDP